MKLTSTVVAAALAATLIVSAAPIPVGVQGEVESKGATDVRAKAGPVIRALQELVQQRERKNLLKVAKPLANLDLPLKSSTPQNLEGVKHPALEDIGRTQGGIPTFKTQSQDEVLRNPANTGLKKLEHIDRVEAYRKSLSDVSSEPGSKPTFKTQLRDGLPGRLMENIKGPKDAAVHSMDPAYQLDFKSLDDVSHAGGSADGVLAAAEGSLHGLRI